MNSDKEPRVVSEIEKGVKRMRLDQESPEQPVKRKVSNTHTSPLPSLGQIKWLAAEGEELLHCTSKSLTPGALLLAMVAILSCQVHGTLGETYWVYVPDPPVVHLASWNDTRIRMCTNDVTLLGGSDSSHILHQWAFYNYSAHSHSPPVGLSRRDGISYLNLQLTSQISSAVGSSDDSVSQKHFYTIVKVSFPGCYPIDQRGLPGMLPLCHNFEEKFFGAISPWLDCAYPILVIHGFGTTICGIGHIGTLPLKKGIG
jgi:hypothetical protein